MMTKSFQFTASYRIYRITQFKFRNRKILQYQNLSCGAVRLSMFFQLLLSSFFFHFSVFCSFLLLLSVSSALSFAFCFFALESCPLSYFLFNCHTRYRRLEVEELLAEFSFALSHTKGTFRLFFARSVYTIRSFRIWEKIKVKCPAGPWK